MKALDKVFRDTQVITGITDKIYYWSKENLYEEGKKTDKERRYQSYNSATEVRKTQQNLSKSKWMEHYDVSSYKVYDSIDFENLTGSFD